MDLVLELVLINHPKTKNVCLLNKTCYERLSIIYFRHLSNKYGPHALCEKGYLNALKLKKEYCHTCINISMAYGHKHISKFLTQEGVNPSAGLVFLSAKVGNEEILNIVKDITLVAKTLIAEGHFDLMKRLEDRLKFDADCVLIAIENGRKDIFEYLYKKGLCGGEDCMIKASAICDVDMFEFVERTTGYMSGILCLNSASMFFNEDIITKLLERGIEEDNNTINIACSRGDIASLDFLAQYNNLDFGQHSMLLACEGGDLRCIKFLQRLGLILNQNCADLISYYGHDHLFKHFKKEGLLIKTIDYEEQICPIDHAIETGNINVLKKLYHEGHLPSKRSLKEALAREDLSVLAFLVSEGFYAKWDDYSGASRASIIYLVESMIVTI